MSVQLKVFLSQAGIGAISGEISEWPQLKPACKWADEYIDKLESDLVTLNKRLVGEKQRTGVLVDTMRFLIDLCGCHLCFGNSLLEKLRVQYL